MNFKKLAVIALPLILSLTTVDVSASPEKLEPVVTENTTGKQYEAQPQDPPSQEVNYVEESELARKMMQAQKAEDAKKYDAYGGGITIIAMCIVVGALIVLSILFYIFGNISSWVISSKKKKTSKIKNLQSVEEEDKVALDTGDVIAAISVALAQHFAVDHDMEDTILTIRRMRKAYSPWNSKIYNMRHFPEIAHHPQQLGKK